MSHGVIWPSDLEEKFRILYAEGFSHSEIATRLGNGITRNACIGKANRLKLPTRKRPPSIRPKKQRYKPPRTIARITAPKLRATEAVALSPPSSAPLPLNIKIEDLKPHHCRWPTDGGSCGKDKSERHESYCDFHARIACA